MNARQTTPATTTTPAGGAAGPRHPDLALARTHLRLGSLSLARTELETFAGRGTLDDDGIRDLAEARWRTGDIGGAGDAAGAWLETHPDDILGLVIAAESQAALGRPGEARRLAGRAMERSVGSLDPIFAGMQRSSIWPVETGGDGPAGVLFDDLHSGPRPVAGNGANGHGPGARAGPGDEPGASAEAHPPLEPGLPSEIGGGPSLWGEDASGADAAAGDALDPTTLFHRGRVALDADRPAEAATGLILAMRASPGLAPAVLDLLAGRREPILVLVRGDAERIVGREVEAIRDHAAAADALDDDAPPERLGPDAAADPAAGLARADPEPDPTLSHPSDQETP